MIPAKEQFKRLREGTVDLLPEEEFLERLERSVATGRPLRLKQGFDPTAPDIHLGHTVGLRKLREFQALGHQVVLIVGNYTSLVGDPSGRSATRPQLTQEDVERNAVTYLEQFYRVLQERPAAPLLPVEIHRNGDWFARMGMREVIKLCARYTLARTLERDDFAKRWDAKHPISVHELLYPLMQGFDSVMIRCDLELGATEQKFNLLVGRSLQEDYARGEMAWCDEFIPESVKRVPVPRQGQNVLTVPVLVGTDGRQRMSKSLGNYIGVSEPANIMYEKIKRLPNETLRQFVELLVDASDAHRKAWLEQLEQATAEAAPSLFRLVGDGLAFHIVERYHGQDAATAARERFFGTSQGLPDGEGMRVVELPGTEEDTTWVGYLAVKAGLAKSTSEARNFLKDGAFSSLQEGSGAAEWTRVSDPDQKIPSRRGAPPLLLRKGKRQETTVKIVWV
jgi:tyrosyl-tRNA synthetase